MHQAKAEWRSLGHRIHGKWQLSKMTLVGRSCWVRGLILRRQRFWTKLLPHIRIVRIYGIRRSRTTTRRAFLGRLNADLEAGWSKNPESSLAGLLTTPSG